ncbi:hypothetical protein Kpol_2002p77 [Vanderwaltozyma polyspora DSM 70294]|uniref:Cell wall mannoprotein PIR1-like C-terminal domain-containing protein n=1 Tax=Vanderwaltozyma polyspora (strain ATCC 22028 / DSM 70294 / BCRC 21397 / CBS 2163 / NBRC 10782 / NRRL Y-8283 / UCD 57-17) TaxID=436907 RepID=A7TFJ2_VANPO|nr:uncharacterized protein Kpol_2002p77 [Vanderwaltozyma polyspora DSM 70294]EDO19006.1 hypothetical protein Kpol_2002p77 [Vanderwaltozyma polyspora DSM 70294]
MQYKKTLASVAFASTALAAYVPSEPWETLTPTGTYKNGVSDYATSFGIAVQPIATTSSVAKRAVVSQIGDGQIQATTNTVQKTTAAAISQIGDGQIQATTTTSTATVKKTTAAAVSQIGDGQIQATTLTTSTVKKTTAAAVSQIGDGQIQATTATTTQKTTAAAVSQIGDGQIQATTATAQKTTAAAVSQIGDGQIQATTSQTSSNTASTSTSSKAAASSTSAAASTNDPVTAESCLTDSTLAMTLKGGILTDSKGRIGSVVANRQFQFDGPPPQAGAIYAAGWSITPEGNLAIGSNDVFYQCLSGNFYNLYDESIGSQCAPVHLQAIDLVKC